MWAPFVTGVAAYAGGSSTQLAVFVRRTVEFAAVSVSWLSLRHIRVRGITSRGQELKIERSANLFTGGTIFFSGLSVLAASIFSRGEGTTKKAGALGLLVAFLGFLVNVYFLNRYSAVARQDRDPIIEGQKKLYKANVFADLSVLLGLMLYPKGFLRGIWTRRVRRPCQSIYYLAGEKPLGRVFQGV